MSEEILLDMLSSEVKGVKSLALKYIVLNDVSLSYVIDLMLEKNMFNTLFIPLNNGFKIKIFVKRPKCGTKTVVITRVNTFMWDRYDLNEDKEFVNLNGEYLKKQLKKIYEDNHVP